jgi:hypothetical protein
MQIKLFTSLSGTAYTTEGQIVDVPDDVAARLIAGGTAVPVVTTPPGAVNNVTGAPETAVAKQPALELRKLTASQLAGIAQCVEYFEADPTAQSAEQLAALAKKISE